MVNSLQFVLLISVYMFFPVHSQKAIILSSSIGYYNYRQTSNALKVYHKLKQYGFKDRDILMIIPQNTGCCQKNPIYGSVSFADNDYTNLNHDVEIDFDYTDLDLERVVDVFRVRFNQYDIGRVKFELSQKPEPLFVYVTGHGGNTYFKIRQREAIILQNFKHLFTDLSLTKRFSKILLFSDSCSAITPFQSVDIQNFVAFGSSSYDQKSQSHGYDKQLNAPKSDDFTFYMMQYFQQKDPRLHTIYLNDLFQYMSFDKLKVHAKIFGKGKRIISTINQFIVKKKTKITKKNFRLQHLI